MPRMTKAFSYQSSENKWFKMVSREAKLQRPKVSESQMMIEIIRKHFEHKRIVADLNLTSSEKLPKRKEASIAKR